MNLIWTSQTRRVRDDLARQLEQVKKKHLDIVQEELALWKQYSSLVKSVAAPEGTMHEG